MSRNNRRFSSPLLGSRIQQLHLQSRNQIEVFPETNIKQALNLT